MPNKKRLIEANALKGDFMFLRKMWSGTEIMAAIDDAPTVDAVEVVHAHWAHLGGDEWCCSACGEVITTEGSWEKTKKKYCHECGAKMDGIDNA